MVKRENIYRKKEVALEKDGFNKMDKTRIQRIKKKVNRRNIRISK